MTSLELAKEAVQILDKKKGMDLKLIGIRDISVLADYFVIATGTSSTHVKALAEERHSIATEHTEGYRSNSWILLDYGNVIVHVFTEESRAFYDLDRLWQDGETVDITEILKANEE